MSTTGPVVTETIVAANDFRVAGAIQKVVDVDGDFTAGGAGAIGVAISKPNSGQHLAIVLSGVTKVYAGAAVTAGARLVAAASGYMVTAGSATFVTGRALEAGNSGDLIRAFVNFANPTLA